MINEKIKRPDGYNKDEAQVRRKNEVLKEHGPLPTTAVDAMISAKEKDIKNRWTIRGLEKGVYTDHLTDLPNRKRLELELERRQGDLKYSNERNKKKSEESNKKFSIVAIDLDGFKAVNDTFGHDVGDKVLKEVATILKNETRKNDVPIRLGGDEFLVIVEDSAGENENAKILSQRIRAAIENINIEETKKLSKVTASIGIAPYLKDSDEMLKMADMASYISKGGGNNIQTEYIKVCGEIPEGNTAKNQIWEFDNNEQCFKVV